MINPQSFYPTHSHPKIMWNAGSEVQQSMKAPAALIASSMLGVFSLASQSKTSRFSDDFYSWLDPKSRYFDETFPKPMRIGAKSIGWDSFSLESWLDERLTSHERAVITIWSKNRVLPSTAISMQTRTCSKEIAPSISGPTTQTRD